MVTPPNFKPGVGRLVTDRYDFQSHLDGTNPPGKTGFRHTSDQIDISILPNIGSVDNLGEALEAIDSFMGGELSKGEGFVTVGGGGYDTWQYANTLTQTYFNNNPDGTPSTDPPKYLDDLLNPIFKAILDNGMGAGLEVNPVPAEFERIKRGGIVLIRSGTYIVKEPILVPPGIILMGEGFGTKIVNVSSLNLTTLPVTPKITSTPAPIFIVVSDGYRNDINSNDSAISGKNFLTTDYNLFMFGRKAVISNMIISDNFVEITALGDTSYKIPQNKTGDNPLILQEQGSNLILENVYLMGRVNFSSGQTVSIATRFAVQLDGYSTNLNGTHLKINNCLIDGFSIPVDFRTTGGSNDYLEISNSKIRSFGQLDGYTNGTTNPESNCIVKCNDNNVIITNNYLYGNNDSITSSIFINSVLAASVNAQAKSKIIMTGNNVVIDKFKNTTNTTFQYLKATTGTTTTNFPSRIVSTIYGNVFQSSVGFEVLKGLNASSQFTITDTTINLNLPTAVLGTLSVSSNLSVTGNEVLGGNLSVTGQSLFSGKIITDNAVYANNINTINSFSSPYTVQSTAYIIIVNTSLGSVTITLPNATLNYGRIIIMKDIGTASAVNWTVNTVSSQTIDGFTSKTISTNYSVIKLLSDGSNWLLI